MTLTRQSYPVCARTALLLAAAAPITVYAAAALLKVGHWQLHADWYRIELLPQPRPNCPRCQGDGGCWVGGAFPEMEACPCWTDRRELRIRLRSIPPCDEPPF